MLTIESKTAVANGNQKTVFDFVTDFRNFSGLLPQDRMNDVEIARESIHFSLQGLGNVGLVIREKKPFDEVNITATEDSAADFNFRILISESASDRSQVKMILQANLNMFLEMVARGPLQQFADMVVDKLSEISETDLLKTI
jgi:hypothetical protein